MKNNLNLKMPLLFGLLAVSFISGAVTILITTRTLPKFIALMMYGMMKKMKESGQMPEMCKKMMVECSKMAEKPKS